MSELSRRKVIGGSIASSLALLTGKAAATEPDAGGAAVEFATGGSDSMSLEEFRQLNGPGSIAKLMGEMNCDTLAMCHKGMKEKHGIWIPELEPIFAEIDARSNAG